MAKPTPIECSFENCGADQDRCGTNANYAARGCRCEPCREASRAYRKDYHAKNRDVANAQSSAWKADNRDRVSEYNRDYRAADPVATKARDAKKNADRCRCDDCTAAAKEYQRLYYLANREGKLSYDRTWAESNRLVVRKHRSAHFHKRRALMLKAWVEDIDSIAVFNRDNWICQRCGIECPRDTKWPAKNFATLDHIVAITKGGLHSYDNVQTLCLSCNSSKGNRE